MKSLKQAFKDMDKVLLVCSIILFVFGLLNIVTASSQVAVLKYNMSLYNYFFKQLGILIGGALVSLYIITKPTRNYRLIGIVLFVLVASLTIAVSLVGNNWSGNKNWISIFGFNFQPSEFAKPVMVIILGVLFELFYFKLRQPKVDHNSMIAIILFVGLFFPMMVFLQKDIGTMIILLTIFLSMFFTSPILKKDKLRVLGVIGITAVIGVIIISANAGKLLSEKQLARFNFFDPCSRYESGGYQICNGFIAINKGGLFGVGIGNSTQKSYIPEAHTDSVFAIISEEYGYIFSCIILLLFIIILYRILKISNNSKTIRGKYMSFGIAIYIFCHILVNLGGLFGIIPLTGVPLPFLSYGGSFTLSLVCALAVVQRIHIENRNEKIRI